MDLEQKHRFYRNIDHLLKKNDVKKTDLEKEASVSQGYMSRFLQKEDPDAFPSVSFLEYCARKFHVSMDDLINSDLAGESPTEEFVHTFIRKLTEETRSDDLIWSAATQQKILTEMDADDCECYGDFIRTPGNGKRSSKKEAELLYFPAMDLVSRPVLAGDVFTAHLRNDADIVMLPIWFKDTPEELGSFEKTLWINKKSPACNHCIARGRSFAYVLEQLENTVRDRQEHIQIEKDVKEIMEWYLFPDREDSKEGPDREGSGPVPKDRCFESGTKEN